MTSSERREARYQRRKASRERKRRERLGQYDDFGRVVDANNLVLAFKKSQSGVSWKASVQRYEMNLLKNIFETVNLLEAGEDVSRGFIIFWLCERGKMRRIKSVHIWERVVQRSLCDNALVPVLQNGLVYDNGASMKGKGIHFALNRMKAHLHEFYRENGYSNDGYILLIDFSSYFDNILHGPVYEDLERNFSDRRILNLSAQLIRPFCEDRKDGLEKSLGIGSQISQILAVRFPNQIDHFIEEELHIRHHARYMDDSMLIHRNKEYLRFCLGVLEEKFRERGIIVNTKKTQIVKLSSWFTFLKWRFRLNENGRVIIKPCHDSITRERRKLHRLKRKFDAGAIVPDDMRAQYDSWRGYIGYGNSYRTIRRMDELYNRLFVAGNGGQRQNEQAEIQRQRAAVRGDAGSHREKQGFHRVCGRDSKGP